MAKTPVPDPDREVVARLSLPLKPDGSIDISRMRESTKNKIQNDPSIRLLFPSMENKGGHESIPPAAMHVIFDLLGSIEMLIASKITNCTPDQAAVFRYTIAEKEALQAPTARLVQKYLGSNMSAYADEIAVAGLLTTTFLAKLQQFQPPQAQAQMLSLVKRENAENEPKNTISDTP